MRKILISTSSIVIFILLLTPFLLKLSHWTAYKDEKPLNFNKEAKSDLSWILEVPANEGNEPFNKHNWFYGTEQEKTREIKKLVKQHLLENKTREQIIVFLGTPDYASDVALHYDFKNSGSGEYSLRIEINESSPNGVFFFEAYESG